jgi:hypothetical protein
VVFRQSLQTLVQFRGMVLQARKALVRRRFGAEAQVVSIVMWRRRTLVCAHR